MDCAQRNEYWRMKLVPKSEALKTRSSPVQFFREFVDDGILENITFQTNLYATQQSQRKGSKQIKSIF